MRFLPAQLFSILFLSAFSFSVFGQNPVGKIRMGEVMVNGVMSGDGFGCKQNPTASVRFGKRISVFGGPIFYGKEVKPSSGIFGTKYCLLREKESFCGRVEMSGIFSAEHFKNVGLCKQVVEFEMEGNKTQADFQNALTHLQFSGWEYSAGIDFIYALDFGFIFHSEASFAYYSSQQTNSSGCFTMRENNGFSLRLGAGIGFQFGNERREKFPN